MALDDYLGLMGGAANIGGAPAAIQNALLGQQQLRQNDFILQQQQEQAAEQARLQAQAQERQRQMQDQIGLLMQNPTPQAVGRFGMMFPEAFKPIKEAYDTLDAPRREATLRTNYSVANLLQKGETQAAYDEVARVLEAERNTPGIDTTGHEQLLELIKTNPKAATVMAWAGVQAAVPPEKLPDIIKAVGENNRADEMQPAVVQEQQAKADEATVKAQYAPKVIETNIADTQSQIARRAAQTANEQADLAIKRSSLELDRDKLTSEIQLRLTEMDRNGVKPDANSISIMNAAVGNAATAQASAARADALASRIVGQPMTSGWAAWISQNAKDAFGGQDPVSAIRQEYQQIINSQAIKSLPPGPASDKDIALAKQGLPPVTASPQYIHDWLRGYAKMQQVVAQSEDRKANWIAANGTLGPAKADINVGGVLIPRGTSFVEFNGTALKRGKQGQTPDSLSSIINKYGGR